MWNIKRSAEMKAPGTQKGKVRWLKEGPRTLQGILTDTGETRRGSEAKLPVQMADAHREDTARKPHRRLREVVPHGTQPLHVPHEARFQRMLNRTNTTTLSLPTMRNVHT